MACSCCDQENASSRLAAGDNRLETEEGIPIIVVTNASQLPEEFLNPSPEKRLLIGFDCEVSFISRREPIIILQFAFQDRIYIVDAQEGGEAVVLACKPALESDFITKVIHDCRRDSEALYDQFGIKLNNVADTQIGYSLFKEQDGHERTSSQFASFVDLLHDPLFEGIVFDGKGHVRYTKGKDRMFWDRRPLTELAIKTAANDVRFLLFIYHKIAMNLTEKSLWYLALRGALYCRCYCMADNNCADWPPLPQPPASLSSEDPPPAEEILSVVHVPREKVKCVIGCSLMYAGRACRADIIVGRPRRPIDKVFIVGPVDEVRRAEAIFKRYMK